MSSRARETPAGMEYTDWKDHQRNLQHAAASQQNVTERELADAEFMFSLRVVIERKLANEEFIYLVISRNRT